MKATHRLYEYFDYKGIKPTRLEKDLGLSNGYLGGQLRRNADIGSGALETIVNYCRDLCVEWVVCGRGDMINSTIVDNTPKPKEKEAAEIKKEAISNEMLVDKLIVLSSDNGALRQENEELKKKLAESTREKKIKEPPLYTTAAEPKLKVEKTSEH